MESLPRAPLGDRDRALIGQRSARPADGELGGSAELSWTDAEQTQAINRSYRIGQTEPVTAWRIIAAQTIDSRIAELIDSKAGLAARARDGSDEQVWSSADVQHVILALVQHPSQQPFDRVFQFAC